VKKSRSGVPVRRRLKGRETALTEEETAKDSDVRFIRASDMTPKLN
jgi:hypothetical protein